MKRKTHDNHHPFGIANSPLTISIPVNDHRASLSVAQYDWPQKTLRNEEGSPLLAGAGTIRGFADIFNYLIQEFLLRDADMLELLDTMKEKQLGKKWWKGTKLEAFEPNP